MYTDQMTFIICYRRKANSRISGVCKDVRLVRAEHHSSPAAHASYAELLLSHSVTPAHLFTFSQMTRSVSSRMPDSAQNVLPAVLALSLPFARRRSSSVASSSSIYRSGNSPIGEIRRKLFLPYTIFSGDHCNNHNATKNPVHFLSHGS